MFGRISFVVAAIIGILIALQQRFKPIPEPRDYVRGSNNTVLFLVNEHPGLSNVHAATAQSLLESHPDIQVHFGSFPKLANTMSRISSYAKRNNSQAKEIIFHPLSGLSSSDAYDNYPHLRYDEDGRLGHISPHGIEGINHISKNIQIYIDPWFQEEHLAHFKQITSLIDGVDPAVVVLDTNFAPAIEATRARKRVHAFITPNMLVDNFPGEQPWLGFLWKYPAMGSGFPFPVPLKLMAQNIYQNFRLISSVAKMPDISAKQEFLKANGVPDPIKFYGLHRDDVPWITQTTHAATVPVDFVPANVTCAGPMTLSAAPAEDQDAELMAWIKQKPTVLINLGSAFHYSRTHTRIMIEGIQKILEATDLQILWKYMLADTLDDDWRNWMVPLEETGRVTVTPWLTVDPFSLLSSGHITAFVTHGGASGFHESIAAGVPQIVLPLWTDTYNYAQLAEQIASVFGDVVRPPLIGLPSASGMMLSKSPRDLIVWPLQRKRRKSVPQQESKALGETPPQGLSPNLQGVVVSRFS